MKIGSLVECVEGFYIPDPIQYPEYVGYSIPMKGNIYTVRDIRTEVEGEAILLEEIVNPRFKWREREDEAAFPIESFREIQPPMEVSIEELLVELV